MSEHESPEAEQAERSHRLGVEQGEEERRALLAEATALRAALVEAQWHLSVLAGAGQSSIGTLRETREYAARHAQVAKDVLARYPERDATAAPTLVHLDDLGGGLVR